MRTDSLERFLSPSARGATRNEIRELLKLVNRPGIISLAGGLPSPETFPLAFMVGSAFHCDGSGRNTLRLNFTHPGLEQLDVAAGRLACCIGAMLDRRPSFETAPEDVTIRAR